MEKRQQRVAPRAVRSDPILRKRFEAYQKVLDNQRDEFLKRWNDGLNKNDNAKLDDFEVMQTLGVGGFGRVLLVKHKVTTKYHAMKILTKERLVGKSQVVRARNEKRVLLCIQFPFVLSMDYFFKNNSYVYFVMPFANGGDMFGLLQELGKFDEKLAKFYATQVILAIEYLHYCKLIYRDLKPENIMIDKSGYLKLTDFGFCKRLEKGRTWSLCGTPEYLAPEIIKCKEYGFAVDWWSFGVLIYEMNAGFAPFFSPDPMQLSFKIVKCKYKFPIYFGENLKDLISNLLQIDLTKRYGNLRMGTQDIKNHQWFNKIEWLQIYEQKAVPPFVPKLSHEGDTRYFTETFQDEPFKIDSRDQYKNEFADF